MKKLILLLVFLNFTLFCFALEGVTSSSEKSGEVKVKIEEKSSTVSSADEEAVLPNIEIELVEKLDSGTSVSNKEGVLKSKNSAPVVTVDLAPVNPDKNLVIYFILLMVIVVGIMIIASLIPGPRSRSDT